MKKQLLAIAAIAIAMNASSQTFNVSGELETWRTTSVAGTQLEAPMNWYGIDSLVYSFSTLPIGITPKRMLFKETGSNAYSGQAAAKVMTRNQGIGVMPGVLANAKPAFTFNPANPTDLSGLSYTGGTPITQRVKSVSAWVKYAPKGMDKASFTAQAVLTGRGAGGKDSIVGIGDTLLAQAISTYTKVGFDLTYNDPNVVPDKLLISFMSSSTGGRTDSSTLWVDEVMASMFPVSVDQLESAIYVKPVVCTPNPAQNVLYLKNNLNTPATICIYGIDGRMAIKKDFSANTNIDITQLAAGSYYFCILDGSNKLVQQEKLIINK